MEKIERLMQELNKHAERNAPIVTEQIAALAGCSENYAQGFIAHIAGKYPDNVQVVMVGKRRVYTLRGTIVTEDVKTYLAHKARSAKPKPSAPPKPRTGVKEKRVLIPVTKTQLSHMVRLLAKHVNTEKNDPQGKALSEELHRQFAKSWMEYGGGR